MALNFLSFADGALRYRGAWFVQRLAHDARFRWFLDRGNTEGTFARDMLAKDRRLFDEHHVALEFFRTVISRAKGAGLFDPRYFAVETTRLKEWGGG